MPSPVQPRSTLRALASSAAPNALMMPPCAAGILPRRLRLSTNKQTRIAMRPAHCAAQPFAAEMSSNRDGGLAVVAQLRAPFLSHCGRTDSETRAVDRVTVAAGWEGGCDVKPPPSGDSGTDGGPMAVAAGGSDVRGAAIRNPLDVKKIASNRTNSMRLLLLRNCQGLRITLVYANDRRHATRASAYQRGEYICLERPTGFGSGGESRHDRNACPRQDISMPGGRTRTGSRRRSQVANRTLPRN